MKKIHVVTRFCVWLSFLTACQGESPHIQYSGVSSSSAVRLILTSETEAKLEERVKRIETDRQQVFDWTYFWTEIQDSGQFSQWTQPMQENVLSLFPLECSQDGVLAKAKLIQDFPNYYDQIFSRNQSCRHLLNFQLFDKFIDNIMGPALSEEGAGNEAVTFVDILHYHYQGWGVSSNLVKVLSSVSKSTWQNFLKKLIFKDEPETAANFIEVYKNLLGKSNFAEFLIPPLVERPGLLPRFIEALDYNYSLDTLAKAVGHNNLTSNVGAEDWKKIFKYIVAEWKNKTWSISSQNLRENPVTALDKIFNLFIRSQKKITILDSLMWIDEITRDLQTKLGQLQPNSNIKWSEGKLSSLWIQNKVLKRHVSFGSYKNEEFIKNLSPLEKIIISRLFINERGASKISQSNSINQFCDLLTQSEIPQRESRIDDFNQRMLSRPGCVKIESTPGDFRQLDIKIEAPPSFFSVLRTGGHSLKIEIATNASQLIIDGSAVHQHAKPPVHQPNAEDNALILPVAFGFRLSDDTELLDAGVYYIPFHYIHRRARDGKISEYQPLAGYSGGDITLSTSYDVHPHMISLGGPGQAPSPKKPGGLGDKSVVNWERFRRELALSSVSADLVREMIRPNIQTLDHIFDNAQRNEDGNIRVLTSTESWLASLENDQKEKIENFCTQKNQEIKPCYHQMTLLAAQQLSQLLDDALSSKNGNYILPQLAAEEFELPGGAEGPENLKGLRGQPGQLAIRRVDP